MPVLRIKKNGIWEELGGTSPMNGGNADTLDGKHAEEFVTNEQFNSLVGNTPVYEQIIEAIHENAEILHISIDGGYCSHSASEIFDAHRSGKMIIVDDNFNISYRNSIKNGDDFAVNFNGYTIAEDKIIFHGFHVYDDKSIYEYDDYTLKATLVVTVDGDVAAYNASDINNVAWYGGGVVKLHYNGYLYDYQFGDNSIAYFICNMCDNNTQYVSVVTIDADGNVSEVGNEEPIIPAPEEADAGKVLVAGSNRGEVSWENASGKTLTEHLEEEDMVLSSRQYGDQLPDPGVPGRIFFLREVE